MLMLLFYTESQLKNNYHQQDINKLVLIIIIAKVGHIFVCHRFCI